MNFHIWERVGEFEIDKVAGMILSGRSAIEATPSSWLLQVLPSTSEPIRLLDFGCGFGRNTFYFATAAPKWNVVGYDNKVMLSRCCEYYGVHYNTEEFPVNVEFSNDWGRLKEEKFDVILCSLVLQHIFEEDLFNYMEDFKHMAKTLVVSGRRHNDEKKTSTWLLLEKNGLVPTFFYNSCSFEIIPYESAGHPEDHHTAVYNLPQQ